MTSRFRDVTLGDLAEIFDGPHATPRKTRHGPVFLGISNLVRGRIVLDGPEHLSEQDFVRWTRRVTPEPGDIVFSYETRLGEAALIPSGLRCCLGRRLGLLRAKPGEAISRFLLYAYLGPEFQETLRARTVPGSTVDRIPIAELAGFPIRVPADLREQDRIAGLLGALDDKIELNRRMSETLEAIARTLFRSSLESAPPGSAQVTQLREVASFTKGRSYRSEELAPSDVALVTLKSFARGGGYRQEGLKPFAGRYNAEQVLEPGDVVVACTDVTQAAEVVGRPALVRSSSRFAILVASLDTVIVRPARQDISRAFLYFLTLTSEFQEHCYAYTTGTTVLHLSRDALPSFEFALPSVDAREEFDRVAAPILERIEAAERESQTLAALRDALLPKLISGELRVGDAAAS